MSYGNVEPPFAIRAGVPAERTKLMPTSHCGFAKFLTVSVIDRTVSPKVKGSYPLMTGPGVTLTVT